MNKKVLTLLLLLSLALTAGATLPQRRTITHCQSDGTTLTLTACSNGRFTTYATPDGTSLLRAADGHYYYAREKDGNLLPTTLLAHNAALRTADEQKQVKALSLTTAQAADILSELCPREPLYKEEAANAQLKSFYASTADGLGQYGKKSNGVVNSIGEVTIPVIMVSFADLTFQDTITVEKVSRYFNEEGYADEQYTVGSVRDYFIAQSGGMFTPNFDVIAHVTLSNGYQYYGADAANGSTDPNISKFIKEALELVPASVDFTKYKVGSAIPNIMFMFAGQGSQSSYDDNYTDYIWAKFSTAGSYTAGAEKTKLSSYLVVNELLKTGGTAMFDGMGVTCHEFSHALGLPDFYYTGSNQTVYNELLTPGYWSVMDSGNYFYDGYRPIGYSAYERSFMGWLQVTELTEAGHYKLYPFGGEQLGPTAYIIRNPEQTKEYLILENRQTGTWYPTLMGHGMMVTHVDYDSNRWNYVTVNNTPEKQRYQIIHADNVNEANGRNCSSLSELSKGMKASFFPGTLGVTSLTDDTTPSTAMYEGSGTLGQPLYNIVETDDGVISFSFIDATMTGITSAAAAAAATEAYTLQGVRVGSLEHAAPGVYILKGGQKVIKR